MREARRAGLTVMLDGQGGDELLAGYRASFGYRLSDLLRAGRVGEAPHELRAFGAARWSVAGRRSRSRRRTCPSGLRACRPRAPARRLGTRCAPELRSAADRASRGTAPSFPDRLRRQLAHSLLTRRGLPELLRYEDRNSMAHSLEARVPLLDHRLVELAFSLTGGELIRRGETKAVLRRALADLLPPTVRQRRDKLGFVTPEARFLRGALGDLAADVFASRSFASTGLRRFGARLRERLDRHRGRRHHGRHGALARAQLELWAAALFWIEILVLTTSYPTPRRAGGGASSSASTCEAVRAHATSPSSTSSGATSGGSGTETLRRGLAGALSAPPGHVLAGPAGRHRGRARAWRAATTSSTRISSSPAASGVALSSGGRVVVTEHWSVFLPEDPVRLRGAAPGGTLCVRACGVVCR